MSDKLPEDLPEEDVGYGRPPKHSRWKPGQSGNPRGKAKGLQSFRKMFQSEAASRLSVKEGGRHKKLSKAEVLLKTMWSKALSGDVKSILAVIALMREILPSDPVEVVEIGLSPEEQKILHDHEAFLALLKGDEK